MGYLKIIYTSVRYMYIHVNNIPSFLILLLYLFLLCCVYFCILRMRRSEDKKSRSVFYLSPFWKSFFIFFKKVYLLFLVVVNEFVICPDSDSDTSTTRLRQCVPYSAFPASRILGEPMSRVDTLFLRWTKCFDISFINSK